MLEKAFPIDFIRQLLEQTLWEEHNNNENKYFGGKNQVNILSFYEQLQKDDEVNRYVEIYRDLVDQQNRTGLIMNGTIIAPENPTITNINQCLIIPMSFTCSFRVKLENRDAAIATINNLISKLKGRKQDIAMFNNGTLLKVGTIANNVDGTPKVNNGDFIGTCDLDSDLSADIETKLNNLSTNGFQVDGVSELYFEDATTHKLMLAKYDSDNAIWEVENNSVIPEHTSFEKYKLSMSFDSIRCDEPRNLNADEYCVISFGGSATLVSKNVMLGNELAKLGIKKTLIKAKTDIAIEDEVQWLEPLELPSGNSANTQLNQFISNKFIQKSHTDSLSISIQYSFALDKSIEFLKQVFKYARYGIQANGGTIPYTSGITPNMIYEITEIWSSWGEVDVMKFNGKIIERIDIENTESDTLSITIPFQVQGDE